MRKKGAQTCMVWAWFIAMLSVVTHLPIDSGWPATSRA